MSDHSAIQWTDATWNPTTGCTKVSPGCAHCYIERTPAFRIAGRTFVKGHIPLQLHEDRLEQPLRWRKPRRVFVNSLSDLFHDDVPDEFIDRVFAVMALCPQHTFQLLTKRAGRMREYLSFTRGPCNVLTRVITAAREMPKPKSWTAPGAFGWPYRNVRVGVSIENQPMADKRFPIICELGEAGWNTMVSLEPLLGPVRIPDRYLALGRKAWCIPGGESGPRARPCALQWIESIVEQCPTGVACFVKQLGAVPYDHDTPDGGPLYGVRHPKGGDITEFPLTLQVREYPPEDAMKR